MSEDVIEPATAPPTLKKDEAALRRHLLSLWGVSRGGRDR